MMDPYIPTSNRKTLRWLAKAARHNKALDRADREAGFSPPFSGTGPGDLAGLLRTAISAIIAGHQTDSWDCVGEGLVMVIEAEVILRAVADLRTNGNAR
jgi:hypothetical protein